MRKMNKIWIYFGIVLILSSCSTTRPRLSYSGGNYHSVSDDIIIYNSTQESISKLANTLNASDKILLVQVVGNPDNELIGDMIFEELFKRGFVVGLSKNDELKEMNTEMFDKFLMFYPTVHGTETSETRPTFWPKFVAFIPVIGWIIGKNVLASYTYDDRQAAINLHCRLVNEKTGEIEWIKNFSGQDRIRIKGGEFHEIVFPN